MANITKSRKFNENRKFRKYLRKGDYLRIAEASGLSQSYISEIFQGFKRMTPTVYQAAKPIIDTNRELEEVLHG